MPLYEFYNTESCEYFEDILSISEKEELLKKNPHIKSVPSTFGIVSGVGDVYSKTDSTWKEVLSKVADAHPNSEVANRYGSKSHKQIKTDQVLKKHKEKWKNR